MEDWNDDYNEGVDLGQAIKKSIIELNQEMQEGQAKKQMEAAQAEQNQIFSDALKEAGLDQQTFNDLVALDPEATKEAFTDGVRNYVGTIARRRDKKGRFIPGKPQPQGRPAPQRPEGKRYDGKGMKTNQDVFNALVDIIGDDDIFKYGS